MHRCIVMTVTTAVGPAPGFRRRCLVHWPAPTRFTHGLMADSGLLTRRITLTSATRPGEWVDVDSGSGLGLDDIEPGTFNMSIPTDRYTSREYAERERDAIWMRVWQIAGRVDELPKVGDWKQYRILDQSFVIVRSKDEKLRGFVNACRHRGNILCNAEYRELQARLLVSVPPVVV